MQNKLHEELKKHPILLPQTTKSLTLDEERRISAHRIYTLSTISMLSLPSQLDNLRKPVTSLRALFQLDPATTIKFSIANGMFPSVLQSLGTARHADEFDKAMRLEVT